MYVLFTDQNTYVVEYLLNELVLSKNCTEAMVFKQEEIAHKFKALLFARCGIRCSVNTFIP